MDNDIRVINRSGVHRCSICNCVNVEDIQTNFGDYKGDYMHFVNDPLDTSHFICGECNDEIEDLRYDYQLMDDWDEE